MRVIDRAGAKVLVYFLSLTYRADSELDYVGIFNNTEFLMLILISMTQAVVGNFDQCHTLRRTIGVDDSGAHRPSSICALCP